MNSVVGVIDDRREVPDLKIATGVGGVHILVELQVMRHDRAKVSLFPC